MPFARKRVAVCLLAAGTWLALAQPSFGHDDGVNEHGPDNIYEPVPGIPFNGVRIYLSPAHHWGGQKHGCDDYVEDMRMRRLAEDVAKFTPTGSSLVDRGYKVRVGAGNPDENVVRSNNWNSDRYISLHSNARGSNQCGYHSGGTIGFFSSGRHLSESMARAIKQKLAPYSPGGVLDDVRSNDSLYEINGPDAPPALIETEFHDWQQGQGWLISHEEWAWRIAYAIDEELGYP